MIVQKMTASFGCLAGDTLTLRPGLNLISAPNGGGKSTWCAFLRAMLYGLDTRARDKKGAPAEKNARRPWNGDPMEGVLECRHGGRDLILRRSSGGGIPFGECSLVDAQTGQPVPGVTGDNVGEYLMGVGREVYDRSVFFRQTGLAVGQSRELERRIAALVTTGQEETTWSQADGLLRTWQRERGYRGSGRLPQLEEEEMAVRDTLSRMAELREDILARREEIRLLEEERNAFQEQDRRTVEEDQEDFDRRWAEAAADLDAAELRLQTVQGKAGGLSHSEVEAMEEEIADLEESIRHRGQKILWFAVAALALALVAVVATFIPWLGGWITASALCIGVALLVVLGLAWNTYRRNLDREDEYEIDRLQEEIDQRQEEVHHWRAQLAAAQDRRENAQKLMDALGARKSGGGFSAETVSRTAVLSEAAVELSRMEGQLAALGDPATLEARLEEIQDEEAALQEEVEALTVAIQALEEADLSLRGRFSPTLNTRAGEYLARLTGGLYDKVTLDRDLAATAEVPGSLTPRPVALLSQGTADQLYLAVRLAMCELVLPQEDPCPLVLDDALTTFDDERMGKALALFTQLAQQRQILLFTCHSREEAALARHPGVHRCKLAK